MTNRQIGLAKKGRKDEFYTQIEDVEREMESGLKRDSDLFRDRSVLLPCDDPDRSAFARYFSENFGRLGLKRLVSTCFASNAKGRMLAMERSADGGVRTERRELEGDGDFRSDEVKRLRDEADTVATNPPFSLFRDFMAWLQEWGGRFIFIGHQNSATYAGVFPLLKDGSVWLDCSFSGSVAWFVSPYEDVAIADGHREGMIRVSGVCWFTNMEQFRNRRPLSPRTMAENLRDNAALRKRFLRDCGAVEYPKYGNCDAIEVPMLSAIPSDWPGLMGVPPTFLGRYDPEQFEIAGFRTGSDGRALSLVGRDGRIIKPYCRVLIRHRRPEPRASVMDGAAEAEGRTAQSGACASEKEPLKFIDLFAGIGGIRIPFDELGCRCVFSSEWDEPARRAYELNYGEVPAGDITKVKAEDIPPFDICLAGFPCQPFSIMGKGEGFADVRGTMFFEIERILDFHRPRALLLENVKRLARHDGGRTLRVITEHLEALGYSIKWKILNALDFGLPQKRERILIVGFLDAALAERFDFEFEKKPYSLADVLEDEASIAPSLWASDYIRKRRLEQVKGKRIFSPSVWHENKGRNVSILDYSCALRTGASHNYLLVDGRRRFTARELLRLQGFPEGWKIAGSLRDVRRQTGNSVAVPMIRMVAQKIVGLLKEKETVNE